MWRPLPRGGLPATEIVPDRIAEAEHGIDEERLELLAGLRIHIGADDPKRQQDTAINEECHPIDW